MMPVHEQEIAANLERAEQSIQAAKDFEIRNVGDYGGTAHVSPAQAERAIQAAESFLRAVKSLLNR